MPRLRERALYLAFISAVARVPGFLIPLLIAAVFGAGQETDAYFLAYGAVFLTGGTLAQGIESAIVHFSSSARHTQGFEDRAARTRSQRGGAEKTVARIDCQESLHFTRDEE